MKDRQPQQTAPAGKRYLLITAAKNEEDYLQATLNSVMEQTIPPSRWIIVSDGSSDGTDDIASRAAKQYAAVEFVRKPPEERSGFDSKTRALALGWEYRGEEPFDYVGILDADVTLPPDYFERLMALFGGNPKLGIGGGYVFERTGTTFHPVPTNARHSVAGAVHFFCSACYEDVGGYRALPLGGIDTVAETMARMRGWEVWAFPELPIYHHKAGKPWSRASFHRRFRDGRKDRALGNHPVFELFKCARRFRERPYILGALVRLIGYCSLRPSADRYNVPLTVMDYIREEQRTRLKRLLRNAVSPGHWVAACRLPAEENA